MVAARERGDKGNGRGRERRAVGVIKKRRRMMVGFKERGVRGGEGGRRLAGGIEKSRRVLGGMEKKRGGGGWWEGGRGGGLGLIPVSCLAWEIPTKQKKHNIEVSQRWKCTFCFFYEKSIGTKNRL